VTKTGTRRRPPALKWVLLALAVAGVVVAGRLLPVAAWTKELEGWISSLGTAGYLAFYAIYVVAALLFVPGSALTIAAGFLFGLWRGTALVSAAATTAAGLGFLIARHAARGAVEARARKDPRFAAIDQAIGERGWKVVALLRLSPVVPFSIGNYFYGLTAIGFGPYLLTSWLAMLPGTVLYVYLGAAGKAAAHGAGRTALENVYLGVGLAATVAVTVYLTKVARRALGGKDLRGARRSGRRARGAPSP
jgi:uncharacterized membrane protein YdjX (TVP38/TMEM64 family)